MFYKEFIKIYNTSKFKNFLNESELLQISNIIKDSRFIGKGTHVFTFYNSNTSHEVIKCFFKHDGTIFDTFKDSIEDIKKYFNDYVLLPKSILYSNDKIIIYTQDICIPLTFELLKPQHLGIIFKFYTKMIEHNKLFPDIYYKNFGILRNNTIKLFDFHNFEYNKSISNFLITNLFNNINQFLYNNCKLLHYNEISYNFKGYNILSSYFKEGNYKAISNSFIEYNNVIDTIVKKLISFFDIDYLYIHTKFLKTTKKIKKWLLVDEYYGNIAINYKLIVKINTDCCILMLYFVY